MLGERGEDVAGAYLTRHGYEILARNFRCRHGEIDLVAIREGVIVFVEVKTRRSERAGTGTEAVVHHKRRRLLQAARYFLALRGLTAAPCRFDVISLKVDPGGARVRHVRNAFQDE